MKQKKIKKLKIFKGMNTNKIYVACHITISALLPIAVVGTQVNAMVVSALNKTEEKASNNAQNFIEMSSDIVDVVAEQNELLDGMETYLAQVSNFYGTDLDTVKNIFIDNIEIILGSSDPTGEILNIMNQNIGVQNISNTSMFEHAVPSQAQTMIDNVKNSEMGQYYAKYGKMYGVDPNLLMAKAMQESGLQHNSFDPDAAYGISQIENTLFNSVIHVHNYETGQDEEILITEQGARDLETNIKYGAAKLQEKLRYYNNNIYLSLQAYNYGGLIDLVIMRYGERTSKTREEIINNPNDLGWLEDVEYYHLNYWDNSTYGDSNYIANVLRYVYVDTVVSKNIAGEDVITNLNNGQSLSLNNNDITTLIDEYNNKLAENHEKINSLEKNQ